MYNIGYKKLWHFRLSTQNITKSILHLIVEKCHESNLSPIIDYYYITTDIFNFIDLPTREYGSHNKSTLTQRFVSKLIESEI